MENLLTKKHEWEIVEREPNTVYVASISYGKDSLAMLEAIKNIVTIHKLSSSDTEKLPAIVFRATLAIDEFKTSTNVANITAIVIIKRLAFGFHSCTVASVITLLFTLYCVVITI